LPLPFALPFSQTVPIPLALPLTTTVSLPPLPLALAFLESVPIPLSLCRFRIYRLLFLFLRLYRFCLCSLLFLFLRLYRFLFCRCLTKHFTCPVFLLRVATLLVTCPLTYRATVSLSKLLANYLSLVSSDSPCYSPSPLEAGWSTNKGIDQTTRPVTC
jgi:hypothetical protein